MMGELRHPSIARVYGERLRAAPRLLPGGCRARGLRL